MKKMTYLSAIILSITLSSCGSKICNCADSSLAFQKEKKAADSPEKKKAVKEKYKSDMDACEKLYDDAKDKVAFMKEADECPSFKELKNMK